MILLILHSTAKCSGVCMIPSHQRQSPESDEEMWRSLYPRGKALCESLQMMSFFLFSTPLYRIQSSGLLLSGIRVGRAEGREFLRRFTISLTLNSFSFLPLNDISSSSQGQFVEDVIKPFTFFQANT